MHYEQRTLLAFLGGRFNVWRASSVEVTVTDLWPERVKYFMDIILTAKLCFAAFFSGVLQCRLLINNYYFLFPLS